ncbi:adenomatous polyposis coli homolog [Phymastichus coffea]|uniref:adenomatous polyposis coli homolog n=1 Tax=Phymastichus coffea TaxID=108790 RepID=UPI00273C1C24|nr:adenomatous polyposis coli homolog [Phymastichus coffea]XP_058790746.1 adenomatous polyposis coli homolog [Phymastichus coffea]
MTTRITRNASKQASTSVNINSKSHSFFRFTEVEFDQPINYSLLYAEENSVIEEVDYFDYFSINSEQENTLITYYTEGTPFQTPLQFSTSTSTSDLLKLDDIRIDDTIEEELREFTAADEKLELVKEKTKEINHFQSFMELENKEKECENTDIEIYLPNEIDFDEKCDEERLERVINVTPTHSPIELSSKEQEEKMMTFGNQDKYSQLTPLMFSRCSSLGSLSGYEQQSLQDDQSSIVSDFSRRTSEVVSPSDLPDSPAQLIFSGSGLQKDKKLLKKKIYFQREKTHSLESCPTIQDSLKQSIFEDNLAVFKEESTPIKFQSVTASSLSSLTIDDDDDVEEQGHKAETEINVSNSKSLENQKSECINMRMHGKVSDCDGAFNQSTYFSVNEEQILDEYIKKGIAKITGQDINDVSSLQTNNSNESNESNVEKLGDNACRPHSSSEFLDENSDLTAEEEKLLNECIRRGIAKVTRQKIDDVTSLSLCTNFSGLSTENSNKTTLNKQ